VTAPTPLEYARWRETPVGRITERLEQRLVLELAGPVRGLAILDVGAGDGAYAVALAKRGARVWAVDIARVALEQANRNALQAGVALAAAAADARNLPFRSCRFDLVLAVTALCFVTTPAAALQEVARVCSAPGATSSWESSGPQSTWGMWRRARALLSSRTWRRAHLWTPTELRRLVSDAGPEPGTVLGSVYHPPCGLAAAALEAYDSVLGRTTTLGAAFLGLNATKPV
jgi:SAM-dependent methyltransferase